MKLRELVTQNLGLKALSLIMAVVIWFFVDVGKEMEISMAVPVLFKNIPAGLVIAGAPPPPINVRLKGPKIALLKFRDERPALLLDLKGAMEGTTGFPALESMITLPEGVRVTRVTPAAIDIRLARRGTQGNGNNRPMTETRPLHS
jgi:hypothetical protein